MMLCNYLVMISGGEREKESVCIFQKIIGFPLSYFIHKGREKEKKKIHCGEQKVKMFLIFNRLKGLTRIIIIMLSFSLSDHLSLHWHWQPCKANNDDLITT